MAVRSHYWPDAVNKALETLEVGHTISVTWIDASRSIAPMRKHLPNHNVETRAVSEGRFFGIQKGDTYNDSHILIAQQTIDGKKVTVESIPLVLVKEISTELKFDFGKMPMLAIKDFLPVFLKQTDRGHVMKFKDGSVKFW